MIPGLISARPTFTCLDLCLLGSLPASISARFNLRPLQPSPASTFASSISISISACFKQSTSFLVLDVGLELSGLELRALRDAGVWCYY
jgi:hypothetical protein